MTENEFSLTPVKEKTSVSMDFINSFDWVKADKARQGRVKRLCPTLSFVKDRITIRIRSTEYTSASVFFTPDYSRAMAKFYKENKPEERHVTKDGDKTSSKVDVRINVSEFEDKTGRTWDWCTKNCRFDGVYVTEDTIFFELKF